jgi:hypothetical protein
MNMKWQDLVKRGGLKGCLIDVYLKEGDLMMEECFVRGIVTDSDFPILDIAAFSVWAARSRVRCRIIRGPKGLVFSFKPPRQAKGVNFCQSLLPSGALWVRRFDGLIGIIYPEVASLPSNPAEFLFSQMRSTAFTL